MPRIVAFIVFLLFGVASPLLGDPRLDHGILNATPHSIHLDVDSSVEHESGVELAPGEVFLFDGLFRHLRIHYSHRTLSFTGAQLRALHRDAPPVDGHWLVDEKGLRSVSLREYMDAFKRMTPKT